MKNKFALAIAASVIASAANAADTHKAPAPKQNTENEKCYGVSKAGKNDCGWSGGACHGSLTKDSDKTAWILMPKGLCERLVGGSLKSS